MKYRIEGREDHSRSGPPGFTTPACVELECLLRCVCVGPSIPDTTIWGNLPTATDASHAESYPPCGKLDASDEGKTKPRLPEVAAT